MKYYVVKQVTKSNIDGISFYSCGVYTDLKNARNKLLQVVEEEKKKIEEDNIDYDIEIYKDFIMLFSVDGDYWEIDIDIDEIEN